MAADDDTVYESEHRIGGVTALVRKLPDDPLCQRISVGGSNVDGFYVVYRGDAANIGALLRAAIGAFDAHASALGPPRDGEARIGGPAREPATLRLRCNGCGKSVSNPVPSETVVRAVLFCPECIEAGRVLFPEESNA